MATDPYWQLEKEYSTIADNADLIVKAIQYEQVKRTENGTTVTDSAPCKVHEYRVKRETLSAASPVLRKLLTAGFRETEQTSIELHEDDAAALEIWLKIMHAASPTLEGVTFAYVDTDIKDVWEVLGTAHKYEIDPKDAKAKAWFEKWYAAQMNRPDHRFGYLDFQALIFPCYTFDHAIGFTHATKQLVYRSNGHITERQPTGFRQDNLHLSSNIIRECRIPPMPLAELPTNVVSSFRTAQRRQVPPQDHPTPRALQPNRRPSQACPLPLQALRALRLGAGARQHGRLATGDGVRPH